MIGVVSETFCQPIVMMTSVKDDARKNKTHKTHIHTHTHTDADTQTHAHAHPSRQNEKKPYLRIEECAAIVGDTDRINNSSMHSLGQW